MPSVYLHKLLSTAVTKAVMNQCVWKQKKASYSKADYRLLNYSKFKVINQLLFIKAIITKANSTRIRQVGQLKQHSTQTSDHPSVCMELEIQFQSPYKETHQCHISRWQYNTDVLTMCNCNNAETAVYTVVNVLLQFNMVKLGRKIFTSAKYSKSNTSPVGEVSLHMNRFNTYLTWSRRPL